MLIATLCENLSACQLVNCLSTQKLTSIDPLSIGFYGTCQLVNPKIKIAKLRAFIHALVSLSAPLIIYINVLTSAHYIFFYIGLHGAIK